MVEVIRGDFLSSCDIWCSILVYHYLFAVCALLVSLVVCCAACLLIMRYRANNSPFLLLVVHIRQRAWFYMLLCSARSKIEVIRIKQTAFHFERLKLCLISAVVVLLVQIWRYYLPRSCFSCVVVGRFSFVHNEVIIYSCVVVVIVDMVGMFHIILLWYNPYIIIYNPYMV